MHQRKLASRRKKSRATDIDAAEMPAPHAVSETAMISPSPQIMPPAVPGIHNEAPEALVRGIDCILPATLESNMPRASVPVAPLLVSVPGVHYVVPPLNAAPHVDYIAQLLAAKKSTR